jgi:anti-sigma B factor antagonist
MGLDFVAQPTGDELVFELAGELDLAGRDELAEAVIAALPGASTVVMDLSGLRFIDSSGLSALLRCRQSARDLGRQFFICGASGAVARVLEMTGIGRALSRPGDLDPSTS